MHGGVDPLVVFTRAGRRGENFDGRPRAEGVPREGKGVRHVHEGAAGEVILPANVAGWDARAGGHDGVGVEDCAVFAGVEEVAPGVRGGVELVVEGFFEDGA